MVSSQQGIEIYGAQLLSLVYVSFPATEEKLQFPSLVLEFC